MRRSAWAETSCGLEARYVVLVIRGGGGGGKNFFALARQILVCVSLLKGWFLEGL